MMKRIIMLLLSIATLHPMVFGKEAAEVAEEAAELTKPELSPEIKLMQEIEPGFVPKDDRAVQLFLLQKVVGENEDKIKSKSEEAQNIRAIFSQGFRDSLSTYVDTKTVGFEEKYERAIDDIIISYERALANNPDHPVFAADALYYLGLYYFERDEKTYFAKLAEYSDAKEQGREDVDYPDEDFSRTIDTYERLIENYPDHKFIDSVYYLLALGLWYEGAFYNAVDTFQDLIKKYPKSRYVEEIWFRLGEYFYDMDDFDDAIDAYSLVAKNNKSPLYDKAIYKIAWAHFQKDRYDQAIDKFMEVLELTYFETGEGAAAGMRAEVSRYIIKSFSEQIYEQEARVKTRVSKKGTEGDKEYAEKMGVLLTDRVFEFFRAKKFPAFTRDMLLETASLLLDESKSDGAIKAFEYAMRLAPRHEDNPRLEAQIVDILQDADRAEEARKRNHLLLRRYGKHGRWYGAQQGNLKAQRFAKEAVRDAILSLAVYYHKQGKDLSVAKDKEAAALNFRRATSLYSTYLTDYPERDDSHKAIFYLAEAAYELKHYQTALDAYQTLKEYPLPMGENIRRDATFNIIFTFRYVLEREAKRNRFIEIDFDSLTSKQRGPKQVEIPGLGLKYLTSIDEFLKIAPSDEQVPVLLFHAAAIYYVYGHSDEAQSRFKFIFDTYQKTPAAIVAARLMLDDAVSKEEWVKVVELARRFGEQNLGGQKDDFARIEGNARFKIARAVFESANDLLKNNQLTDAKAKYKESADLFKTLLEEDPKNPFADVMIFNSARAIVQSGTTAQALPLYRKLYTQYPKSEYAKTARFQEALALEKMLKFAEAARAYDGIIKQDPKSDSAGDAMLNKALLYEAAGDLGNAANSFVAFAKLYPKREEAPVALLTVASIRKKQGRISQQIAMIEQFISQYKKDDQKIPAIIEAHVQIADTYADLEASAKAPASKRRYANLKLQNYRTAIGLYNKELGSPIAAFYAAKAQLIIDKPDQESFRRRSINARSGKAQGEQLTSMMKRLTELSQQNQGVIKDYAQPVWNAESLYRIGRLYEHLAQSMIKAPCPRDVASLDEFACDEYTVLLEDKSAVLEEKAVSAYKQAYEIAISAYDSPETMVVAIQTGLNRIRPGDYQRVGKVIEIPSRGAFFGHGRMLSTGHMAATLHPQETDPDRKKVIEPIEAEAKEEPLEELEAEKPEEVLEKDLEEEFEEKLEEKLEEELEEDLGDLGEDFE